MMVLKTVREIPGIGEIKNYKLQNSETYEAVVTMSDNKISNVEIKTLKPFSPTLLWDRGDKIKFVYENETFSSDKVSLMIDNLNEADKARVEIEEFIKSFDS